jgi:carbon monoxide dehydrogenase subunit G
MAHVEEASIIVAPIEQVFDVVADSRQALRWLEGFDRFDHVSGPERGVGARVRAEGRMLGFSVETYLDIVEYDSPYRLISESTKGVRSRTAWILDETEGGTRVSFIGDYTLPLGLRLLGDRALGQLVSEQTRRSLVNLKRLCENSATAR